MPDLTRSRLIARWRSLLDHLWLALSSTRWLSLSKPPCAAHRVSTDRSLALAARPPVAGAQLDPVVEPVETSLRGAPGLD
ncbi:hypothetical protein ACVW00_000912 [Marmoricola sp. URHA0025 HA25]